MSSEKIVSISHIYPITFSIINKHMAIATDDRPRVAEFKATVRKSLSERMEVGYNFGFRSNVFLIYIIHSSYPTHIIITILYYYYYIIFYILYSIITIGYNLHRLTTITAWWQGQH